MVKLLIVDDQAGIRFFLGELFKNTYDVTMAENGKEALEKFKGQPYDLVLTDMKMPGLDGLGLIKAIRELDKKVPVVIMTAYNETCTAETLQDLNVASYIAKPFDIHNVREVIISNLAQDKD